MATESPLIHDGSQTTAAADYSVTGQFLAVYVSGARQVTKVAAIGHAIYGILQNKPASGQAADVGVFGVTKAVCGSAGMTAGDKLMTNASGQLITWTAGSSYVQVGVALETAVTNQLATVFIFGPGGPLVLT